MKKRSIRTAQRLYIYCPLLLVKLYPDVVKGGWGWRRLCLMTWKGVTPNHPPPFQPKACFRTIHRLRELHFSFCTAFNTSTLNLLKRFSLLGAHRQTTMMLDFLLRLFLFTMDVIARQCFWLYDYFYPLGPLDATANRCPDTHPPLYVYERKPNSAESKDAMVFFHGT